MNAKSFFFGLITGVAAAALLQKPLAASTFKQPENVLHKVKSQFKKNGPISGSWIEMKTQSYAKGPFTYTVYKGGITRNLATHTEQWEFIADAKTGLVLETYVL
ncbi:MAG TPA: hypothetical protein VNM69_05855 [Bacillus sp. (in: firmicutes)]|uniref:hypothetical protein n=1 Tax=Bacillus litorisediminis TaxID=2922713 RepID=UPI001FAC856A|nr:hypothetical protein [Bacillus litorisediminis]HWO75430.1 hypothetical protein [Bacillus sp. (in: firmicutes)]